MDALTNTAFPTVNFISLIEMNKVYSRVAVCIGSSNTVIRMGIAYAFFVTFYGEKKIFIPRPVRTETALTGHYFSKLLLRSRFVGSSVILVTSILNHFQLCWRSACTTLVFLKLKLKKAAIADGLDFC